MTSIPSAAPLRPVYQEPIFSIDTHTWFDTAKDIALLVLKIVIFPWGIYELVKYAVQRAIMTFVYPAQSCFEWNQAQRIQNMINSPALQKLMQEDIVRQIVLEKNGLKYTGWMISDPKQRDNGKWALQAAGNGERVIEYVAYIGSKYMRSNFNTILIDNPGVGTSQGISTPKTMGEVQELALTFIESQKNVQKVALLGRSLGGAAIAQAILQHDFKPMQYLVVQQMTFGSLSHVAKKMIKTSLPWLKPWVAPLIRWTDLEMDTVEASRKLAAHQIPECIINRRNPAGDYLHDGVIPAKASLGARLHKLAPQEKLKKTTFWMPTDYDHNSRESFELTAEILSKWDSGLDPVS